MLTADRVELFFTDQGDGPCLVFAHSWALNSDQWHYVVAGLLDKGYRCVTYDRRGHGRSDRHGGRWSMDLLADDLARLIGHLDLKDVTLVGHSMGCSEIVRYVTRHGSGRVRQAVFLAPILPLLIKVDDNPDGVAPAHLDAALALRAGRAAVVRGELFAVFRCAPQRVAGDGRLDHEADCRYTGQDPRRHDENGRRN
jgi:pimeloyl-ACP methyl ester carboxylesterase